MGKVVATKLVKNKERGLSTDPNINPWKGHTDPSKSQSSVMMGLIIPV